MNNVSIRYNKNEEMMEIKNDNKTIFYGNWWDFSIEPKEIKNFLKKCGLTVTISNDLEDIG